MKRYRFAATVLILALLCAGCAPTEVPPEPTDTAPPSTTAVSDTTTSRPSSKTTVTTTTTKKEEPVVNTSIFTEDILAKKELPDDESAPIRNAVGTLNPNNDAEAATLGSACASEISENQIADFEKNIAYCEKNGGSPDQMVHVSTFTIIGDMVYMTYYANAGSDAENPHYHEARFAYCPLNDPSNMSIQTVQKVGDTLEDEQITKVYDTILMHKDDKTIYVMWTASTVVQYYRFYRTFDVATKTMGPVRVNRFKVGDVTNDFSISGIKQALYANGIAPLTLASDIGMMQKLSTRVENGVTYYYTGAYAWKFNCIIKSRDLITWEYVSSPSFDNQSEYENAVYVVGDRVYYFVRQFDGNSTDEKCTTGFLTYYDLNAGTWAKPLLITDAQSRSDFIYYKDNLYLIHAPKNRSGIGVVRVDTTELRKSKPVMVVNMQSSCFYPYVKVYGNEAYLSYTVDRKHIRLSKFCLDTYL